MQDEPKYITIRELPESERPRERLAKYGATQLQNHELLAIMLRTGTHRRSALMLAQDLLQQFGNLGNVLNATVHDLSKVPGIGLAKAAQILASLELGHRASLEAMGTEPQIKGPEDVYALLVGKLVHEKREHFITLLLNTKNRVMKTETISIGTLDSSLVHPREVFRPAIREGASSLILAHNHPSGDPTPSPEDVQVTKRLKSVGEMLQIDVLDHVIVAGSKFVSLRQQGLF